MRSFAQVATLIALTAAVAGGPAAAPEAAPAHTPSSTLYADVSCVNIGHTSARCDYWVSGGTAPYTYSWSPTKPYMVGDGYAYFKCNPYEWWGNNLTVRDATGATATAFGSADC